MYKKRKSKIRRGKIERSCSRINGRRRENRSVKKVKEEVKEEVDDEVKK